MPETEADLGTEMQRRMVAFVRAFGLHRPEETPCGAPVSVSEAHALSVLAEEGPSTQTALGHHLELTKSTVSRLVDQLSQRGWTERRPAPDDGRKRQVHLTESGHKLADEINARRRSRLTRLLEQIPEGERTNVLAALDTLAEAARATHQR